MLLNVVVCPFDAWAWGSPLVWRLFGAGGIVLSGTGIAPQTKPAGRQSHGTQGSDTHLARNGFQS